MAQNFAKIQNGIVINVIVADKSFIDSGEVGDPTTWVESVSSNLASIGDEYHADISAFITPVPYASWTLDKVLKQYVAPIPMPNDGQRYRWNEQTQNWYLPAITITN